MAAKRRRRGLSMVEVLVVIGIIAILLALLLPAILSTRGAARKVECTSHLKQLGLALHGYHDSHKCFPPAGMNAISAHVFLLPYIERRDLYDQVEFETKWPEPRPGLDAISEIVVPILQCPADPGGAPRKVQPPAKSVGVGTNFALNTGTRQVDHAKANGLFRYYSDHRPLRDADVTDGLSNTAAMAEVLLALKNSTRRARVIHHTQREYDLDETEAFIDECLSIPMTQLPGAWGFLPPWTRSGSMHTTYNHVVSPNSGSCINRYMVPSAILTPASEHTGGVSVLLGDGSVRFVSDGIDRPVWQGLGTVAGGEMTTGLN